jgi:hypothetical protein
LLRTATLAAALLVALAPAARAQDGAGADPDPLRFSRGVLVFTYENDMFADTDRYYTSGHRAGWQSRGGAPRPLAELGGWLEPWLLPGGARAEWGLALGQTMYTSRRRLRRDPPRDDRPYAGHLAAALSLQAADETSLGVAELSLGVIGPAALGEQVQDLVHDAIGVEKLGGWGRQIGNTFAGMLSLERRWRFESPLGGGALAWDLVPALGANLGNVQTSGAASLLVRFGHGLAMDFGPPRMRPALSGLGVFRPPEGLAWYLYAGAEGRAIAYDETLDGNRNGYWRVDRSPLVGEALTGLVLAWGPVRLDGSVIFQSSTFDEQSRTPHVFTATSLSVAF